MLLLASDRGGVLPLGAAAAPDH